MNLAAFTSHSGGVPLAENVPGKNQRAAKVDPTNRRRMIIKKILIRLNIIGQLFLVYLFGDFLHKSNERSSSVDAFSWLGKDVKLGSMGKCIQWF